ncbi:NADPH-dependent FMN reductase [Scatolibacter rhodanostii]|uniref:NADPH-dependent FMN reductase n=1 Tax=Scatolibacter rhodanostii TaxID=2014781 RepID=UPI000C070198|nr:NAD(P)H-dependent oxidoreductase [Scatolibacter rhodanostii]
MKKIVAVVGSFRENSFNKQLALKVKEMMKGEAELEVLEYSDVPLFNEDIEFPAPKEVSRVREKIKAADGVWFFTPEYNHSYPGVLKNLLDWLSRPVSQEEPQVLFGKAAAMSGAAYGMPGTATAQEYLIPLLFFFNMRLMNSPRVTVGNIGEQLDQNGKVQLSPNSAKFLEDQVKAFLAFTD